ncbi:Na/Pi cotransporter family protein [Ancylobacter oerskovii]|uniref:Na/Pi cotransporter family protein n=1 Tax=Ancylobacter oerskovii TaxID=459519 RepID=A0ABW4YYX6_9HYPH|nr:Na/Pi cotransporter family protein [Ancylobacter oerskovii]MBS7543957.1 Na/Pi cotransporter family protein [Ancylobacter oerskovii]
MTFPASLIDLAGFIALLLWGTHMVQTGVQRAFGPRLKSILGAALGNRLRAFAAGLGVTTLLQSSTATGLMVTGFAAGGLVELVPALAVMLGANVGTTLIVQLLSFDIAVVAPAFILVGVMMFRRDSSSQTHDLGRVLIGLGLMLMALDNLLDLMRDYEDAPSLRILLGAISTVPLLDVLLAAGLTWAAHSSVAVVLLVMSLAANGAVPPNAAFALVLGANIGTAINPLLEGVAGTDPAAKRVPLGNLLTRLVGVAIALAALQPIGRFMVTLQPVDARAVADFHTLFNVVVAVVFLPVLGPFGRMLTALLPDSSARADPSRPLYLDPAAKETPIVALGGAAREALRLADVLETMLTGARDGLRSGDRRLIAETRRQDDVIDQLNTAIKAYLTSIDPDELGPHDHRRLQEVLSFTMNLEQAGDVVDRYLLPHTSKGLKRGLVLPPDRQAELLALMDRLIANLRTAASLFMTEDPRAARLLGDEKMAFRDAESRATLQHFEGLRDSELPTAQASALYLDLLRDMKLINSHLVAAAAYPILERSGELLPSRIARN